MLINLTKDIGENLNNFMSLPHKIDIEKKVPEKMHIEYKFDTERDIEIMDKINEIISFLTPQEEEKEGMKKATGRPFLFSSTLKLPPVSTPKESWNKIAAKTALDAFENKGSYGKFSQIIFIGISKAVEAERGKYKDRINNVFAQKYEGKERPTAFYERAIMSCFDDENYEAKMVNRD